MDDPALDLANIFLFTEQEVPEYLRHEIDKVKTQLKVKIKNGTNDVKNGFSFVFSDGKLKLNDPELGLLCLDFQNDINHYKRKKHKGKSEPIAKALGAQKGIKNVFDATAGLAQDAFFLTQLGFNVVAAERSPILYLLLKDAEARLQTESKITFLFVDAKDYLLSKEFSAEAVYIDPMFPEKKKTALPRKEMQIFRKLVGDDEDGAVLLQIALDSNAERVVVKRPLKAPALKESPIHSFEGTTVRFDLYTGRGGR